MNYRCEVTAVVGEAQFLPDSSLSPEFCSSRCFSFSPKTIVAIPAVLVEGERMGTVLKIHCKD